MLLFETINIRCREDPDNCYLEGLSEWLRGCERSWTDVFEALSRSSVGHNDLAKVVERRFTKATGNTEYRLSSSSLAINGLSMDVCIIYTCMQLYLRI